MFSLHLASLNAVSVHFFILYSLTKAIELLYCWEFFIIYLTLIVQPPSNNVLKYQITTSQFQPQCMTYENVLSGNNLILEKWHNISSITQEISTKDALPLRCSLDKVIYRLWPFFCFWQLLETYRLQQTADLCIWSFCVSAAIFFFFFCISQ